jgi:hypothetical protein
VLVVERLALDVAELREDVRCHDDLPRVALTVELQARDYCAREERVKERRRGESDGVRRRVFRPYTS